MCKIIANKKVASVDRTLIFPEITVVLTLILSRNKLTRRLLHLTLPHVMTEHKYNTLEFFFISEVTKIMLKHDSDDKKGNVQLN